MNRVRQVQDLRALAGAISLVLVGSQLSIMLAAYFVQGGDIFAVFQTRWWWEIALNLQIVTFFLMYLSHSTRVKNVTGAKKVRAWWHFFVGMFGVSVPSWVMVIAAGNDWFRNPPDQGVLIFYIALVFVIWFVCAYVLPYAVALMVGGRDRPTRKRKTPPVKFKLLLCPIVMFATLCILELLRGGNSHIIMWPFLTYLYGALHYFWAAYVHEAK